MPGSTPTYGLPYLTSNDALSVSALGQDLATALDSTLGQLGSAWTSGTPTWTQADGSVLTIGNGTLTMRRKDIAFGAGGKTVHVHLDLVRGSTSNFGSDTFVWGLPPGWPAFRSFRVTGSGAVYLASGVTRACVAYGTTGSTFVLAYSSNGTRVGNQAGGGGHPSGGSWATGDAMVADITYEAA